MSKDIFMADYSKCRDTNREIQSNLNYIEEILSRLRKMDEFISGINVSSDIWDKSDYDYGLETLTSYLNNETSRYESFHSAFDLFHTPLEDIDSGLKSILENALTFIDKNEDYGVYMSIIKSSQIESVQDSIYDQLIEQGVSEEDASKISALENEETQELLNELLGLNESELEGKIQEIKDKAEKSPSELILLDILSLNKGNTYSDIVKDVSSEFAEGGLVAVLQTKYLGKSLDKYNLDIKSLTGQINKIENQLANSQLSKSKVNIKAESLAKLNEIKQSKLSNINRMETTQVNLTKLSKYLKVAGKIYNIVEVGSREYKNFVESGYEIDDIAVDAVIEGGGIAASAVAGSLATSEISGAIGTSLGPGGTIVGLVGGFFVGGAIGALYGGIVKPVATDIYNNMLEPAEEWIVDKTNDVGDWWDSLWW